MLVIHPMRSTIHRYCVGLLLLSLTFSVSLSDDRDKEIRLLKDKDNEEKLMSDLGIAVTKAAHPTGENPSLRKYKITEPKESRIKIVLEVQYKGTLTGNLYFGEAVIVIDRKEKEVLKLDFTDLNNSIPPNDNNLRRVKSQLEKLIEKLLD